MRFALGDGEYIGMQTGAARLRLTLAEREVGFKAGARRSEGWVGGQLVVATAGGWARVWPGECEPRARRGGPHPRRRASGSRPGPVSQPRRSAKARVWGQEPPGDVLRRLVRDQREDLAHRHQFEAWE